MFKTNKQQQQQQQQKPLLKIHIYTFTLLEELFKLQGNQQSFRCFQCPK